MRPMRHTALRGIVQATIPVSDLARSARFYQDLLGLQYVREFGDGSTITGCALADFNAHFFIALRRRDTLVAGGADLRGEHPVIVEAESPEAADHIRRQASRLGISSTSGTHADGTWIEFLDPDGIALRVVHSPTPTETFLGITFGPDGTQRFYHQPRLDVPIRPSPADGHRPSRRTPQPQ
jgi:catechol 2,3-dioxygenase-like lactoylglutathione lyase family enzyme